MKVFLLFAVVALVEGKLNWCQECSALEPCPNDTTRTACIVDICSTLDEGEHKGPGRRGCEAHPETKYRVDGDEIIITFSDGVYRKYVTYYDEAAASLKELGRAVDAKESEDNLKAKFKDFKGIAQLPAYYAKPPVGTQVNFNKTFPRGGGGGEGQTWVELNVEQLYIFDAMYAKFRQQVHDFEMIFLVKMANKNFKPSFEELEKAYRNLPSVYH